MFLTSLSLLITAIYLSLMIFFVSSKWWLILIYILSSPLIFILAAAIYVTIFIYSFNFIIPKISKLRAWIYFDAMFFIYTFIFNIDLEVEGRQHIPLDGNLVIYSNHKSYIDPIMTIYALRPRQLSFTPKSELYKSPFMGLTMIGMQSIPIYRNNTRKTIKGLKKGVDNIDKGLAYVIYPEGGRKNKETDKIIVDLKGGAFKLGQKSKSNILCLSIINNHLIKKRAPFRRTNVKIKIHPLIKYEDIKDLQTLELADKVKSIINQDKIM